MPGDGPRLRSALDARALVPPERDAVTGRLAAQARQRKDDRSRPRSRRLVRHVLRTPAGITGAAIVAAAAVVGITLAATSGSSSTPSASQGSLPRATGPAAGGPPGQPVGGQPPPACEILTADKAAQVMGKAMKVETSQNNSCSYWSTEPSPHDFLAMAWALSDFLGPSRDQAVSDGRKVEDLPQLGDGAFGYPARTTQTSPSSREWTPAGVAFSYGGITWTVYLGRTDGESRTADPSGDEQLAVAVAEQLLADLKSGAIEVS